MTAAGLLNPSLLQPPSSYKSKPFRKANEDLNDLNPTHFQKHDILHSEWRQLRAVLCYGKNSKQPETYKGLCTSVREPCIWCCPTHLCTTRNGKDVIWTATFEFHHSFPQDPHQNLQKKSKSKKFFLGWLHTGIGKINTCLSTSSFTTYARQEVLVTILSTILGCWLQPVKTDA